MRKILFFAIALVASALVFTACEGNGEVNPTDVKASDYIGQKWRTAASYENGTLSHLPHALVNVISDKQVVLNGLDTTSFTIKDGVLTLRLGDEDQEFKIKSADKETAVLTTKMRESDFEIHMALIPKSNGDKKTVNAENIAGTWTWDWIETTSTIYLAANDSWTTYYSATTSPGIETWEFKADGTLIKRNTLDAVWGTEPQVTWWALENTRIAIGDDSVQPSPIPDSYWYDITELTSNVFYLNVHQEWQGGASVTSTYYLSKK